MHKLASGHSILFVPFLVGEDCLNEIHSRYPSSSYVCERYQIAFGFAPPSPPREITKHRHSSAQQCSSSAQRRHKGQEQQRKWLCCHGILSRRGEPFLHCLRKNVSHSTFGLGGLQKRSRRGSGLLKKTEEENNGAERDSRR